MPITRAQSATAEPTIGTVAGPSAKSSASEPKPGGNQTSTTETLPQLEKGNANKDSQADDELSTRSIPGASRRSRKSGNYSPHNKIARLQMEQIAARKENEETLRRYNEKQDELILALMLERSDRNSRSRST
jgi:hypothetical protein